MAFLNAALPSSRHARITWIEFPNIEYGPEYEDDKKSMMDIVAKTASGEYFSVEIQLANRHDMDRRTLYYWSRVYTQQLKRGMAYLELRPTVTINLLNFRFLKQTERYHTTFHLREDEETFLLTDMLEVHFMELPKLLTQWGQGQVSPEEDQLVRWLLLLEAEANEEIRERLEEIAMEDPVMKQAFEQWEALSQDEASWWAYESRRKAVLDEMAWARTIELNNQAVEQEKLAIEQRELAIEQERLAIEQERLAIEQREIAIEQARQEMQQQVIQAQDQAQDQGKEEGKEKSQRDIAVRLLAMGVATSVISQATGLSETELEALRASWQ
jgi:predicted transposase/invertase (TIGR01784 family)